MNPNDLLNAGMVNGGPGGSGIMGIANQGAYTGIQDSYTDRMARELQRQIDQGVFQNTIMKEYRDVKAIVADRLEIKKVENGIVLSLGSKVFVAQDLAHALQLLTAEITARQLEK